MTRSDFSHFLTVTWSLSSKSNPANRLAAVHAGRGCFFDMRASSVLVLACNFSMIRLT